MPVKSTPEERIKKNASLSMLVPSFDENSTETCSLVWSEVHADIISICSWYIDQDLRIRGKSKGRKVELKKMIINQIQTETNSVDVYWDGEHPLDVRSSAFKARVLGPKPNKYAKSEKLHPGVWFYDKTYFSALNANPFTPTQFDNRNLPCPDGLTAVFLFNNEDDAVTCSQRMWAKRLELVDWYLNLPEQARDSVDLSRRLFPEYQTIGRSLGGIPRVDDIHHRTEFRSLLKARRREQREEFIRSLS